MCQSYSIISILKLIGSNILFMLQLFIQSTASSTTADLHPPFTLEPDGTVGVWEFSGAAQAFDDHIMLVSPVQYKQGAAWTNVEIPKGDWGIRYQLQIKDGNGGGGFAFWFTDVFGANGPVNGGPSKFKGVALLGTIFTNEDGSKGIEIHLIQNDGRHSFRLEDLPEPQATIHFDEDDRIIIQVTFEQSKINVFQQISGKLNKLFMVNRKVSISDNYIGITAQSDIYTSLITLFDVDFLISEDVPQEPTKQRSDTFGGNAPSGEYTPLQSTVLRHPKFNDTLRQLFLLQLNPPEVPELDFQTLFNIIHETVTVSYDIASFKELNNFVRTELIPYTSKWHKRTIKMVEEVQNARNVLGAAFNYTNEIMNSFDKTIKRGVLKTNLKIINLTKMVVQTMDEGVPLENEAAKITKGSSKWMTYFGIAELVLFIIAFIVLQIPSVRTKIYRY